MIKYKKRIWPMLYGIALFVVLVLSVCIAYVSSVLVVGVSQDLEKFDGQVSKIAALIKQENAHFCSLLNSYGDYISEKKQKTLFSALNVLQDISLHSSFDQLGIVGKNGKGYLLNGTAIHILPQMMHSTFISSQKLMQISKEIPEDTLIYGMPYFKDHQCEGMIIGIVDIKTVAEIVDTNSLEALKGLYLLDEKGQVIIKDCVVEEPLDCQLVTSEVIYSKEKWEDIERNFHMELINLLSSHTVEEKNSILKQIIGEEGTIWYKHEIEMQEGKSFTLMVARKVSLSTQLRYILSETAKAASVLGSIFIFFFAVMLLTNRIEQRRLGAMAYIDAVTEGENWNKLKIDAKKQFKRRRKKQYALVTFDIDHFKLINDIYGHNRGNELLRSILKIINKQLQKKEEIVRYSGDVFAALVFDDDEMSLRERMCKWQVALSKDLNIERLHFRLYTLIRSYVYLCIASERHSKGRT